MRLGLGAMLALWLAACSSEQEEPLPGKSDQAESEQVERKVSPGDPTSCERDEQGQVACLTAEFDLEACDDARVLGSMFRDNEKEGTYEYNTAFGLGAECVAELRDALGKKGFREGEKGDFVATRYGGVSETIIIGMQISADGSVVEWERTKQ